MTTITRALDAIQVGAPQEHRSPLRSAHRETQDTHCQGGPGRGNSTTRGSQERTVESLATLLIIKYVYFVRTIIPLEIDPKGITKQVHRDLF